jgi:hypothetical protein
MMGAVHNISLIGIVTTSPLYNEYIVIQIKIINETLFLVGQSQLNLSVA